LIVAENHELAASLLKEELEEVEGNSTQSVAMEDHNFADTAGEDSFQKGEQAFALEVDARSDVLDDFDTRSVGLEEVDLSLEVLFLVVG
jgi:hypothetical protein